VNPLNPPVLVTFVKVHGLFATRGEITQCLLLGDEFVSQLDAHIESVGTVF
jgi:hypothetical protein